jgi:hypothetical protein
VRRQLALLAMGSTTISIRSTVLSKKGHSAYMDGPGPARPAVLSPRPARPGARTPTGRPVADVEVGESSYLLVAVVVSVPVN